MNQVQQTIADKFFSRAAGFTRQRAGTAGYSLKINNMRRKAVGELMDAGMGKIEAENIIDNLSTKIYAM